MAPYERQALEIQLQRSDTLFSVQSINYTWFLNMSWRCNVSWAKWKPARLWRSDWKNKQISYRFFTFGTLKNIFQYLSILWLHYHLNSFMDCWTSYTLPGKEWYAGQPSKHSSTKVIPSAQSSHFCKDGRSRGKQPYNQFIGEAIFELLWYL